MRLKIKFLSIFFLTVLLGAFTVKSAFADSLTLSGHLTDRTGSGVGGVNIALTHDQGDTVVATAQTDGSGFYSIQATSGSYEVRIIGDPQNASSVLPETIRLITSGDSVSLTQDTTLDLQIPSSLVTVHVQDPSQNPVENAFVRVSTGGQITVGSLQFNVIEGLQNGHTDVSGNVTIPALPGTATISVTSPTATLSNASVSQVITGDTTLVISLQFNNNPPHINTLSGGTINEGQTYSENGSFTDPDSTSWTGRVDYGDGSGEHDFASPNESIDQTNHTFSISHVYKDNGTYTVTVKITDNQGAVSNPATATVTVNNVEPTPGAITISPNPVQINTSVTATVNFTDP